MRIVVLSDTHAPRFWKRCPPAVADHLRTAEVILHAGDVCVASVLEELSTYAPVHAVVIASLGRAGVHRRCFRPVPCVIPTARRTQP